MQNAVDAGAAVGSKTLSRTTALDWSSLGALRSRQITRFRHNLGSEPLLRLESLRALSKRLAPKGQVKFKPTEGGGIGDLFLTADAHRQGWTIDEVFNRMGEPASWLAIYQMNTDAEYAAFCERLMTEIREHVGTDDPGMYGPDLAVFLSSPPAFTPYHIDQHPVFFFQLRGKKRLNLWNAFDPEVLDPELAEHFLCSKTEGLIKYRETIQAKVVEIELGPGEGFYWPATTPHLTHTESHWVTPDDNFSLSFNISYYSNETRRRVCVSAINEMLRRHSPLRPHPYGQSMLRDRIKYPLGRAFLGVRRWITGSYLRPEQGL